jgi:hypothetical protein
MAQRTLRMRRGFPIGKATSFKRCLGCVRQPTVKRQQADIKAPGEFAKPDYLFARLRVGRILDDTSYPS